MIDRSNTSKFDLDGVPPLKESIPLGLQHLLAMFIGNIVPMVIVSQVAGLSLAESTMLIQCSMIGSAIATLIQLYPIKLGKGYRLGSKLPVFLGLTYAFLPVCISVAGEYGLAYIFGAQLIGAFVSIFFGIGLKKMRKYFTPIVTGTVVLSVGLSLFSVGIGNLAGGIGTPTYGSFSNWFVGIVVVGVVLYFSQCGKGLAKNSAILIGIAVGYILALMFGMIDFSPIKDAAWFALPKPFAFGVKFKLEIIITFILIYFITAVQLVGDFSVSSTGGLDRQPTDEELAGGILGNSFACIIAAILNCFPTATYSQCSGIVALTKVVSRFAIGVGAVILLIAGFCPKLSALLTTIPNPVVGGATIVVFSMIAMSGINLITMKPLTGRNMLIVGVGIAFGIGVTSTPDCIQNFPEWFKLLFGNSSVVLASTITIVLSIIFPEKDVENEKSKRSMVS